MPLFPKPISGMITTPNTSPSSSRCSSMDTMENDNDLTDYINCEVEVVNIPTGRSSPTPHAKKLMVKSAALIMINNSQCSHLVVEYNQQHDVVVKKKKKNSQQISKRIEAFYKPFKYTDVAGGGDMNDQNTGMPHIFDDDASRKKLDFEMIRIFNEDKPIVDFMKSFQCSECADIFGKDDEDYDDFSTSTVGVNIGTIIPTIEFDVNMSIDEFSQSGGELTCAPSYDSSIMTSSIGSASMDQSSHKTNGLSKLFMNKLKKPNWNEKIIIDNMPLCRRTSENRMNNDRGRKIDKSKKAFNWFNEI